MALERNPDLAAAATRRTAVEGEVREANAWAWRNPEITVDGRDRRSISFERGEARNRDGAVGISQTFEIAGQHHHRRAAAQHNLGALQAELAARREALRLAVERRFGDVLVLQERVAMETEMRRSFEQTALGVGKRVAAGEDSRLDGNLAQIELERALSQAAIQQAALVEAQEALASLLQLPAGSSIEVEGKLEPAARALAAPAPTFEEPQLLRSLRAREEEARSRLDLERAARVPDLTLGLSRGREKSIDGRDDITTLNLSLPLPFFRHNDAAIGRAAGELERARIARMAMERDLAALPEARARRVQVLADRVARLRDRAVPALEENRRLSQKAFDAGEIGLLQMIVVNRQLIDGRRDLLEASAELRRVSISLEAARLGIPDEPMTGGRASTASPGATKE